LPPTSWLRRWLSIWKFEPAALLELSYQLDLTQLRLAPFSRVTYWWVAVDERGYEWRAPEQQLEYADDQFAWRQLSRQDVAIYWTGDDLALGETALAIVSESLPRIRAIIPVDDFPNSRLHLPLAGRSADAAAPFRS
jgi:hypothetical protein